MMMNINIAEASGALCMTLLHSLWQGLLVGLTAGLVLLLTKKSPSYFRYNLLLGLLGLFIISISVTFALELQHKSHEKIASIESFSLLSPNNHTIEIDHYRSQSTSQNSLFGRLIIFLNEHAVLLTLIWSLISLVKLLRLLTGLYFTQNFLVNKAVPSLGFWDERIKTLSLYLKIKRTILLLESTVIKVPITIGFFKPIILIPAGFLTGLPVSEVEAILLHELSHIKRGDYLVNLVQCFIETIFFFNPALLWVSSLIRTEREHCCDEMALNTTQDKKGYISALISFQEYYLGVNSALAFSKNKNSLLDRVKRIVNQENKRLNSVEKWALLLSSVIMLTISLQLTEAVAQQIKKDPQKVLSTKKKDQEKIIQVIKPTGIKVKEIKQVTNEKVSPKKGIHITKSKLTIKPTIETQNIKTLDVIKSVDRTISNDNMRQLEEKPTTVERNISIENDMSFENEKSISYEHSENSTEKKIKLFNEKTRFFNAENKKQLQINNDFKYNLDLRQKLQLKTDSVKNFKYYIQEETKKIQAKSMFIKAAASGGSFIKRKPIEDNLNKKIKPVPAVPTKLNYIIVPPLKPKPIISI